MSAVNSLGTDDSLAGSLSEGADRRSGFFSDVLVFRAPVKSSRPGAVFFGYEALRQEALRLQALISAIFQVVAFFSSLVYTASLSCGPSCENTEGGPTNHTKIQREPVVHVKSHAVAPQSLDRVKLCSGQGFEICRPDLRNYGINVYSCIQERPIANVSLT